MVTAQVMEHNAIKRPLAVKKQKAHVALILAHEIVIPGSKSMSLP